MKNGPIPTPLKRTITALDDEEASERKLQKLDLPEVNPEVQSGEAAQVEAVGADLAAEDVDEVMDKDLKPDLKPEVSDAPNGHTEDIKPDVKPKAELMDVDKKEEMEDEEVDPLDAYMNDIGQEVKKVNQTDAKRMGLLEQDHDDNMDEGLKNKAEEELTKAEALLQWVVVLHKMRALLIMVQDGR